MTGSLKTKDCQFDSFVTGGTASCHFNVLLFSMRRIDIKSHWQAMKVTKVDPLLLSVIKHKDLLEYVLRSPNMCATWLLFAIDHDFSRSITLPRCFIVVNNHQCIFAWIPAMLSITSVLFSNMIVHLNCCAYNFYLINMPIAAAAITTANTDLSSPYNCYIHAFLWYNNWIYY